MARSVADAVDGGFPAADEAVLVEQGARSGVIALTASGSAARVRWFLFGRRARRGLGRSCDELGPPPAS